MKEAHLFYPLAAITVVAALAVIKARNPVYGAISLVGCFFGLAAIYVLLAAHFVAIIQILVYAGAIMVLFLFVIMLLALTESELGEARVTLFKLLGAGAAVAVAVLLVRATADLRGASAAVGPEYGSVAAVGRLLLTEYLVPFELVSLLLLVAIVGAVVVAKGRI